MTLNFRFRTVIMLGISLLMWLLFSMESSRGLAMSATQPLRNTPTEVPGSSYDEIFVTTNAGVTWTAIFSDTERSLSVIRCPDPAVCFVVSGQEILTTVDTGNSWTSFRLEPYLTINEMTCPDTTTCMTLGGFLSYPTVISTEDEGQTWMQRDSLIGSADLELRGLDCPTRTVCFASGMNGLLITTSDGGQTWQHLHAPTTSGLTGISCPTITTCYAVGYAITDDLNTYEAQGTIVGASDGGAIWTVQPTDPISRLWDIVCPSPSSCFAVGDGVISTTNGGATWQAAASSTTLEAGGYHISCLSTTNCFTGGYQGMWATVDGHHWTRQISLPDHTFNSISCPGQQTCFAIATIRKSVSPQAPLMQPTGSGSMQPTMPTQAAIIPVKPERNREISTPIISILIIIGLMVGGVIVVWRRKTRKT